MSDRLTRNAIVAMLGTPDKTEGSLNDPIEREEHGIRFNEKWVYEHLRHDPSGAQTRMMYWHRYDFVGTLVRESGDDRWKPDTTLIEVSKRSDGRMTTVDDRHEVVSGKRTYRPASEVRDSSDLGGHIEGEKE
jgi:hypothetical protein